LQGHALCAETISSGGTPLGTWMVILRLIHIVAGVFWAGGAFFLVSFVSPAVEATGAEGRKFIQQMSLKSGMSNAMAGMATLTALSGIIMYIMLTELDTDLMHANYYVILAIGAAAGLAGWIVGLLMITRPTGKMKRIVAEIESSGGPPSPEQMTAMQASAHTVGQGSRIASVLLVIAVVCMASAQPLAALLA